MISHREGTVYVKAINALKTRNPNLKLSDLQQHLSAPV